jgi:hypothetical protein
VHGPWIKLGGGKKDGKDKDGERKEGEGAEEEGDGTEEKGDGDAEEDVDKEMEEQIGGEESGIPDPEALRRAADDFAQQRREHEAEKGGDGHAEKKEKKKPRKLEVRGKQGA